MNYDLITLKECLELSYFGSAVVIENGHITEIVKEGVRND